MTQTDTHIIDLTMVAPKGAVLFLSGKDRGIAARKTLQIDEVESKYANLIISIPDFLIGINSSFANGLLAATYAKYESENEFEEHVKFEGDLSIIAEILVALRRGASGGLSIN